MPRPTVHRTAAVLTTLLCTSAGLLVAAPRTDAAVTVHEGTGRMAWAFNCDSVVLGYPYKEISSMSFASALYDHADAPLVGETFYVAVQTAAVGNPYPCAAQKMLPDMTLPAGLSLAISSTTPIRCTRMDYSVTPYTVTPETALCPATAGSAESGGTVGLRTSAGGAWTIPTGVGYEIQVPVKASAPGYVEVKFPVRVVDGNDNPVLTPVTPLVYVGPAEGGTSGGGGGTGSGTSGGVTPSTTTGTTTGAARPLVAARVARTVRLRRTRWTVPAVLGVTPAGALVEVVAEARLGNRWVRLGRTGLTATAQEQRASVRLSRRTRTRVAGGRLRARLVVRATAPAGQTVRHIASFTVVG